VAVWVLREGKDSKDWLHKDSENPEGRSLGHVSSEIENDFLREWVVMRALPGDIILMEGRPWVMYRPIGLRFEQRREGDKLRDVIVHTKEQFPQ
jgi:hypothetical protein